MGLAVDHHANRVNPELARILVGEPIAQTSNIFDCSRAEPGTATLPPCVSRGLIDERLESCRGPALGRHCRPQRLHCRS
jgi:hypothetical protein